MQALRQLGGGIIIAIVSVALVIGGISLAIAESAPAPSSQEPVVIFTLTSQLNFFTPTVFSIPTFFETPFASASQTPSLTSPPPPPTLCPPPPNGWSQIIVGINDTIYTLAQRYATTEDALKNANCLSSVELQAGSVIYVPPVFSTAVVVSCSPPFGWVKNHVVQPGENLYRIALSYGLTYPQLQQGNCMGNSITIYVGQRLWVPNIPTLTPIPGITLTPTFIFPTVTQTPTQIPTSTFTPTFTQIPSATSTFLSTASPVPTSTSTLPPANTTTPSITPFPSP